MFTLCTIPAGIVSADTGDAREAGFPRESVGMVNCCNISIANTNTSGASGGWHGMLQRNWELVSSIFATKKRILLVDNFMSWLLEIFCI